MSLLGKSENFSTFLLFLLYFHFRELLYLRVENLTLFSPSFFRCRGNIGKIGGNSISCIFHFSFWKKTKRELEREGKFLDIFIPVSLVPAPPWQGTEERGAGGMKGRER